MYAGKKGLFFGYCWENKHSVSPTGDGLDRFVITLPCFIAGGLLLKIDYTSGMTLDFGLFIVWLWGFSGKEIPLREHETVREMITRMVSDIMWTK